YGSISQKIRTYLCLLHPLGKIHLRIDWVNIHFIHIAMCFTPSDMITSILELCRHLSCSPCWIIRMKMVDNLFTS
ncbi:hypothetical protein HMPREF9471_01948, partial [[Clostridium] clostridioforme WAL-7855]